MSELMITAIAYCNSPSKDILNSVLGQVVTKYNLPLNNSPCVVPTQHQKVISITNNSAPRTPRGVLSLFPSQNINFQQLVYVRYKVWCTKHFIKYLGKYFTKCNTINMK